MYVRYQNHVAQIPSVPQSLQTSGAVLLSSCPLTHGYPWKGHVPLMLSMYRSADLK